MLRYILYMDEYYILGYFHVLPFLTGFLGEISQFSGGCLFVCGLGLFSVCDNACVIFSKFCIILVFVV